MIKRFSKIIAIVLMLTLCLSSFAMAVDARSSAYIKSFSASASGGSGKITVSFNIKATDTMSKLGASMIEIKNSNGVTVKTFHAATTSGMTTSDTVTFNGSVTYSGTAGEQYYAVVYFIASNSSGYDTASCTTSKV